MEDIAQSVKFYGLRDLCSDGTYIKRILYRLPNDIIYSQCQRREMKLQERRKNPRSTEKKNRKLRLEGDLPEIQE